MPIKDFSLLTLSASYFAIEFAKRKPARVMFLIFSPPPLAEEAPLPPVDEAEKRQKQFEGMVQQGRGKRIDLELYFSQDEYFGAVGQFVRDHNVTQIIMAVPPSHAESYGKFVQEINTLRSRVECQLVTVRPKEEAIF